MAFQRWRSFWTEEPSSLPVRQLNHVKHDTCHFIYIYTLKLIICEESFKIPFIKETNIWQLKILPPRWCQWLKLWITSQCLSQIFLYDLVLFFKECLDCILSPHAIYWYCLIFVIIYTLKKIPKAWELFLWVPHWEQKTQLFMATLRTRKFNHLSCLLFVFSGRI